MSRPTIRVQLAGPGSLISGYMARDLMESVTGRPPVWMPLSRGWSAQERTARSVVALAEHRGYDVVTGHRAFPVTEPPVVVPAAVRPERPDHEPEGLF